MCASLSFVLVIQPLVLYSLWVDLSEEDKNLKIRQLNTNPHNRQCIVSKYRWIGIRLYSILCWYNLLF